MMDFNAVLNKRRALRSMDPVEVDEKLVNELAGAASLAPSCANKQPWRFVFVHEQPYLGQLLDTLPRGNSWAKNSSMVIAVVSKPDLDCVIGNRLYYQFDTGMATAMMMLKATEMGLIAHPIAGFNPDKTAELLNIPEDYEVITLLIVGKQTDRIDKELPPEKQEIEKNRPVRKSLKEIAFHNQFKLDE